MLRQDILHCNESVNLDHIALYFNNPFVSIGHFAVLINDAIPPTSQYKWLDMAAIATGDEDPATTFIYEPMPFDDRLCAEFPECKAGDIVVICNTWAKAEFRYECKRIYE